MRILLVLAALVFVRPAEAAEMQTVGRFAIDRTEVTIGAFRRFAAATGLVTDAERRGGGEVFEAGWVRKPGWSWRTPFGVAGGDDEPAVHVTFEEARGYCRWAGKRLPTDAEWLLAAHVEHRDSPPAPFSRGRSYPYPTGETPVGANCLGECGAVAVVDHRGVLARGIGHARAGTTVAGVNGLFEMGGNAWEWTDGGSEAARPTRGGSWWYGAAQMQREHVATKPAATSVVYIGFRCATNLP